MGLRSRQQQQQQQCARGAERGSCIGGRAAKTRSASVSRTGSREQGLRHRKGKWIGLRKDAPAFLTNNPYLRRGFRLGYSVWDACVSVIENNHNQIGNVWTHLLGAVFMVYLAYDASVMFIPDHARPWDRSALVMYCLAAAVCMMCSTVFHLFGCLSHHAFTRLCQCDYSGINILIYASDMIAAYNGWYCQPDWQRFYMTSLTALGLACVIGPLFPWYYSPKFRTARVAIFSVFGTAGAVTMIHSVYARGLGWSSNVAFGYSMMLAHYIGCVVVYIVYLPERWFPGVFDHWGNSHNLYAVFVLCVQSAAPVGPNSFSSAHIQVVIAAWWHYRASASFLAYNLDHPCAVEQ